MSQINDLLQDSQAQFRAQRNETRSLVTKWEATGLLEGVTSDYDKHNTAILLENQAKQLISEANSIESGTAREDWNGVALPLVRRIFGELSAKEFVSVQPMNLPSGLVFWMDFKYGTDKGMGTGSLFGNSEKDGKADTTSALYGEPGKGAGYSLNQTTTATTLSGSKDVEVAGLIDFDADLWRAAYFTADSGVTIDPATSYDGTDLVFGAATGAEAGEVLFYTNTLYKYYYLFFN